MTPSTKVKLRGQLSPPGDKSVGHRLAFLSAIADGTSVVSGFPPGQDCGRSVDLVRALGVDASLEGSTLTVSGRGLSGLKAPATPLDAGNSGSTARMACGFLAPQPFDSQLVGDESLSRRPFGRVVDPLTEMGGHFETTGGRLPVTIHGQGAMQPIDYTLPVPSAQVKTAILFAGLFIDGATTVRETLPSRDHSELALRGYGVELSRAGGAIRLTGRQALHSGRFNVPGDFSSAAFFIAAAAFLPGSDLVVTDVGLNPTRTGLLQVLGDMGADIEVQPSSSAGQEPMGTIRVRGAPLTGVDVAADRLPAMIDEVPALAVVAAYAQGTTRIEGASELRVKESDRLQAIVSGLRALGADVEMDGDGFAVHGGATLRPCRLESFGDHRMVMAWAVASLGVAGDCRIDHLDQVRISYPGFWTTLNRLTGSDG